MAQGRLFDGDAAKKAGLVDNVGTLNDTIVAAAKEAKIERRLPDSGVSGGQDVRGHSARGVLDGGADAAGVFRGAQALPPSYRQAAYQALEMVETLRQEKVLMALPVGIVEK